jgi:hypothetical protein
MGYLSVALAYQSERRWHAEGPIPASVATGDLGKRFAVRLTGRTPDELLADFGRIVRFAFFVAAAGGLYLAHTSADWTAFNTPFAELTLAAVFRVVAKAGLFIVATVVWCRWAFAAAQERDYEAWARLGCLGALCVLLYWLFTDRIR